MLMSDTVVVFFLFNVPATTEIYTLSLHDALPISHPGRSGERPGGALELQGRPLRLLLGGSERHAEADVHDAADRKSTRLNSSHTVISYAVFCLKKKTKEKARLTAVSAFKAGSLCA